MLKVEPKNINALVSRGAALRGLDRLPEAEAGYKAALDVDPNYVPAHFNLGILYQEYLNKLDEAVRSYGLVLQHERQNGALRTEVTNRIKAVRIQIQNMQEVEEMMRQQKAQEAAQKAAEGASAPTQDGAAPETPAGEPSAPNE